MPLVFNSICQDIYCINTEVYEIHIYILTKNAIHCIYKYGGHMIRDKIIQFNYEKNEQLKKERGIGFEDVILAIENGNLIDDIEHPNKEKYPNQNIFIILIEIKNYIYYVPYVEDKRIIFLKTIIPSRKLNKKYSKEAE